MRVVVIGGTGHIGTYLAPALVEAGRFSEGRAVTLDLLRGSSHCSIEKARSLLGYRRRYGSLEAIQESVA